MSLTIRIERVYNDQDTQSIECNCTIFYIRKNQKQPLKNKEELKFKFKKKIVYEFAENETVQFGDELEIKCFHPSIIETYKLKKLFQFNHFVLLIKNGV